jgi:hypothetical protein
MHTLSSMGRRLVHDAALLAMVGQRRTCHLSSLSAFLKGFQYQCLVDSASLGVLLRDHVQISMSAVVWKPGIHRMAGLWSEAVPFSSS